MKNIIYILTNEAMSDICKIGFTNQTIEQRVSDLSRATGVPLPFEVFYAAEVSIDSYKFEQAFHSLLEDYRLNPKREFFSIAPEKLIKMIKLFEQKDITPKVDIVESPEEQKALDRAKENRPRFNFDLVQIKPGSKLYFTRDNNITAEVLNSRQVLFEGEALSVSEAAKKALEKVNIFWKAVQGPEFWEYEGEILNDIRKKLNI